MEYNILFSKVISLQRRDKPKSKDKHKSDLQRNYSSEMCSPHASNSKSKIKVPLFVLYLISVTIYSWQLARLRIREVTPSSTSRNTMSQHITQPRIVSDVNRKTVTSASQVNSRMLREQKIRLGLSTWFERQHGRYEQAYCLFRMIERMAHKLSSMAVSTLLFALPFLRRLPKQHLHDLCRTQEGYQRKLHNNIIGVEQYMACFGDLQSKKFINHSVHFITWSSNT